MDILRDIASGALPASELPAFIAWLIGRTFWVWVALLLVGFWLVAK